MTRGRDRRNRLDECDGCGRPGRADRPQRSTMEPPDDGEATGRSPLTNHQGLAVRAKAPRCRTGRGGGGGANRTVETGSGSGDEFDQASGAGESEDLASFHVRRGRVGDPLRLDAAEHVPGRFVDAVEG